jgi:fumarate hydratase subunit alpha
MVKYDCTMSQTMYAGRVKVIRKDQIVGTIAGKIAERNIHLNDDVRTEILNYAGPFDSVLRDNMCISDKYGIPVCQDTGIVEFFVEMGNYVRFDSPLSNILDEAVRIAYSENPFRYSTVGDPVFKRINTFDNLPSIVHVETVEGNKVKISFLIKGGGSENRSALFMLSPSIGTDELTNIIVDYVRNNASRACPPIHLGIGLGGSAEYSLIISKKMLLKDFNEHNSVPEYAQLERKIYERINRLGVGFQGLGSGKTVYAVHIGYAPTHIATLPMGISIDCYISRRGSVEFEDYGS